MHSCCNRASSARPTLVFGNAINKTKVRAAEQAVIAGMNWGAQTTGAPGDPVHRATTAEMLVDVARPYGVDPTTIGRLQSPFHESAAAQSDAAVNNGTYRAATRGPGGTSAVSACGTVDKREIPEDQGTSAARSEI
jgi:hypothetical protein